MLFPRFTSNHHCTLSLSSIYPFPSPISLFSFPFISQSPCYFPYPIVSSAKFQSQLQTIHLFFSYFYFSSIIRLFQLLHLPPLPPPPLFISSSSPLYFFPLPDLILHPPFLSSSFLFLSPAFKLLSVYLSSSSVPHFFPRLLQIHYFSDSPHYHSDQLYLCSCTYFQDIIFPVNFISTI